MLQNAFVAFRSVERSRSQANDARFGTKFLTARERVALPFRRRILRRIAGWLPFAAAC
jgi:hypothetical protein